MKPYIALFIPVENNPKVQEGDWIIDTHSEPNLPGICYTHLIGKEWEFYKAQNGWYPARKVELYICTKNIKPGDIVQEMNKFKEFEWTRAMDSCLQADDVFKIIGKISSNATWIKNGDELEEDQINRQWYDDSGSHDSGWENFKITRYIEEGDWKATPHEFKRVQIKCPCCGDFK